MTTVTLKPKSNKGRNRVSRFGTEWRILRHVQSIFCLKGEGFLITPVNTVEEDVSRWVERFNDPDFEVTVNEAS